jgi:2,3-bisphosphoglycerate-independent phosphoglycerate mutase
MVTLDIIRNISVTSDSKIVMLIMDGLGGLPDKETGKTELETAFTPNLDRLAQGGICGLSNPIEAGITPGSGPGHLALFGYNPVDCIIGRGVLEALGINFDLKKNDVAARGNFCTVDSQGTITDRRAGRISTEKSSELCKELNTIRIEGIEIFVLPVKEHRFMLVLRGDNLDYRLKDTDPQLIGEKPLRDIALTKEAKHTADLINMFVDKSAQLLSRKHPANMVLLRGFSKHPEIPTFQDLYKLNPAAIARYPMYKGLAKLAGMEIYNANNSISEEFDILGTIFDKYDFFFIHVKETDSSGEDGDFRRKVSVIEEVDTLIPKLTSLNPEVIVVTGDHSTPALLKAHGWQPVPCLIHSQWCRTDSVKTFSESACIQGGLGIFPATNIILMAMANALKLSKYGA